MNHAVSIQSRAMLLHHHRASGAVEVTVHSVTSDKDGGQSIGSGVVLGAEEKSEIASILASDTSNSELSLFDEYLLARSAYGVVWWMPKAKRELLFRTKTGVERVTVDFPTVIGVFVRGRLHFAATKGGRNARPTPDTELFRVPLPNGVGNGSFCRGNVSLPNKAIPANREAWGAFLWDSVNTHMGNESVLKGVKTMTDMVECFREAESTGRFPVRKLVPMDTTLGAWLKSLDRGD